jgi:hypothetical protein
LGEEWINNYSTKLNVSNNVITLKPWQAAVVKLK